MINNGQSTLLLYCCEDVKLHRSGGDTMPLRQIYHFKLQLTSQDDKFHMMESNNSFSLNKNNINKISSRLHMVVSFNRLK